MTPTDLDLSGLFYGGSKPPPYGLVVNFLMRSLLSAPLFSVYTLQNTKVGTNMAIPSAPKTAGIP
jgi:hypothetical protein